MRTVMVAAISTALVSTLVMSAVAQDIGSPTSTKDLLSGMVTAELEPGVFRIDDDGHRELAMRARQAERAGPVIGHDGSIWYDLGDRLYELGEGRTITIPTKRRFGRRHLEVAPDGTIWTTEQGHAKIRKSIGGVEALRSFDGEKWTLHKREPVDFDIAPDGTVWAAWHGQGNRTVVGSYGEDGWKRLPGAVKYGDDLTVTKSGDVWMSQWYEPIFQKEDLPHPDAKTTGKASEQQPVLYHYVDGVWENVIGPHANVQGGFGFGTDGVLRVDTADGRHLFFEDDEWLEWQTPTRQPAWEAGWPVWDISDPGYMVSPDGSLWANWMLPPEEGCSFVCFDRSDGVVRFDGDTFEHFLPGHGLQFKGFTPDGAAWFTGSDPAWTSAEGENGEHGPLHTYVMVPEAASPTD